MVYASSIGKRKAFDVPDFPFCIFHRNMENGKRSFRKFSDLKAPDRSFRFVIKIFGDIYLRVADNRIFFCFAKKGTSLNIKNLPLNQNPLRTFKITKWKLFYGNWFRVYIPCFLSCSVSGIGELSASSDKHRKRAAQSIKKFWVKIK